MREHHREQEEEKALLQQQQESTPILIIEHESYVLQDNVEISIHSIPKSLKNWNDRRYFLHFVVDDQTW